MPAGNVYVADFGNAAVKEIPFSGGVYGTPVILGSGFVGPIGVAVDASGNVYVADYSANAVLVIPAGSTIPFAIGSGFNQPASVAADAAGNVYVADLGNHEVKMIPASGGPPVAVGSGFVGPYGVTVDPSGNVYVADEGNSAIKEIPAGGGAITTLGSGFLNPTGVAIGPDGNAYVADYAHSQVKEVKMTGGYFISPALPAGLSFNNNTGVISGTPVKGSASTNYTVNAYNPGGGKATTISIQVNLPFAPTISYTSPQTYTVGTVITALAPTSSGVAAAGYSKSPVAFGSGFHGPNGVATDAAGNVYVADFGNSAVKRVPAGGGATTTIATIPGPAGVAVDAAGNICSRLFGQCNKGNTGRRRAGTEFRHRVCSPLRGCCRPCGQCLCSRPGQQRRKKNSGKRWRHYCNRLWL